MKKLNLEIVSVDDWEGYYVNGKLCGQGHSIRYDELIEKLQKYFPINTKESI